MSSGGQFNAPQTPFSPNYRERRSVQPRGPGNAYTQRPGQQPNPQQPAQLQPAPRPKFGPPDQPPPGMMLNPEYKDAAPGMVRSLGPDSIKYVPDSNQPQSQTGGDIQYAGGTPGFYNQGGQGYGNPFGGFGGGYSSPFGGGFGGGYSTPFSDYGGGFGGGFGGGYGGGYNSPYMSSSMMGGLASLFGGMQGGGFQGMFNPQSQAEAQMRAYQQYQQRDPNQPPPGMKLNPTYNAGYAMAQDMPPPGSPAALSKQQFVNQQNEADDPFKKLMATLSPEERAKYHGTSEHRNSPEILEQIRSTRQHPEWGRYYQNKSDDEIYAGMQMRPI